MLSKLFKLRQSLSNSRRYPSVARADCCSGDTNRFLSTTNKFRYFELLPHIPQQLRQEFLELAKTNFCAKENIISSNNYPVEFVNIILYLQSSSHAQVLRSIEDNIYLLSLYPRIIAQYAFQLLQIGSELCSVFMEKDLLLNWFTLVNAKRLEYPKELRYFLNLVVIPIFQEISKLISDNAQLQSQFEQLVSIESNELQLLKLNSLEKWSIKSCAVKEPGLTEVAVFLNSLFSFRMMRFIEQCRKLTDDESVVSYRFEFQEILNHHFSSTVPEIELDKNLVMNFADFKDLAEISSINSVKHLAKKFFQKDSDVPLPIYNNSVYIEYLGLVDETEFEHNKDLAAKVLQALEPFDSPFYSVFLGPSGTGKTHDILKLACKAPCLFFTAEFLKDNEGDSNGSSVHFAERGFNDSSIATLINSCKDWLEMWNINEAEPTIYSNFVAEYLTEVLILSRVLYYEKVNEMFRNNCGRDISPKEFLYLQINGKHANQFYIRILSAKLAPKTIQTLLERKSRDISLFMVLDECFYLENDLIGIKTLSYDLEKQKTLLTPVAKALATHAKVLLFSGNKTIITTTVNLENSVGKRYEQPTVFNPKFAENIDQVKQWLKQSIKLTYKFNPIFEKYKEYLNGLRIRGVMCIASELCSINDSISAADRLETAICSAVSIITTDIATIFVNEFKRDIHKQATLFNIAYDCITQFMRHGVYVCPLDRTNSIDLVRLALCSVRDDCYYSTETVTMKAMIQFLVTTGQFGKFLLKLHESTVRSIPRISLVFVLEDLIALVLLNKSKAKLIDLIPNHLHAKLSNSTTNWLTKSIMDVNEIKTKSNTSITYKTFVKSKFLSQEMMRLNNVSCPNFVMKQDMYTLSIAIQSSKYKTKELEKLTNNTTVDLHYLFHNELKTIMDLAFELKLITDRSYSNADYSVELAALAKIIQHEHIGYNVKYELFEKYLNTNIRKNISSTLRKWKRNLEKDTAYYSNTIAPCLFNNQLRVLIDLDNTDEPSKIIDEGKIVTVVIARQDLHKLFDDGVQKAAEYFFTLFK